MNTEHTNQSRQAANAAFEQWWQRHGLEDPMDDGDRYYITASSWARRGYLAAMQAQLAESDLLRNARQPVKDIEAKQAEPAHQAEPSQEWFDCLIEDVSAIDCMHRGDPFYEHDAYWMRDRVIKMLEKRRDAAQPPAVAVPTIKLGLYGRAFDTPQTRRAYTYQHQPDNLDAYNLGRAAASTSPGGDNIDRGLSLLKELQAHGFGVFELGDQQEGGA